MESNSSFLHNIIAFEDEEYSDSNEERQWIDDVHITLCVSIRSNIRLDEM